MYSAYGKLSHAGSCWKSPLIIESHINGLRTKFPARHIGCVILRSNATKDLQVISNQRVAERFPGDSSPALRMTNPVEFPMCR